jgi:hypothetical protein
VIAQVGNIICGDLQQTFREVAEEVGISIGSCHTILTEDLGMHLVTAKFVPRLLTDDLLQRANDTQNLLKNVIMVMTLKPSSSPHTIRVLLLHHHNHPGQVAEAS